MSCPVAEVVSTIPVLYPLLCRVVRSASSRPHPGNAVIAGNTLSLQMDKRNFAKKMV